MQVTKRWDLQRSEIIKRHAKDVERAQEAHDANVEWLQQEWLNKKEEVGAEQSDQWDVGT